VAAPAAPAYWTHGRILLALIAVPGVLIVAPMLFFSVIGALGAVSHRGGGGGAPALLTAPNFVIGSVDSNEDCDRLADYCVRGSCTIINSGDGAGSAEVEIALEQDGGQVGVFTQNVSLGPGERKTITHDFGEARLMGEGTRIQCQAR